MEAADRVYRDLTAHGYEVLYDDRAESAGVKFNDADLIGLPVRVVVSPRNLANGELEVQLRREGEGTLVPLERLAETVVSLLERA